MIFSFFVIFTISIFLVNLLLMVRGWFLYAPEIEHNHNSPKISIIVPVYNEEVNILISINSILKQDYSNYDIIIVNDGSKDDSVKKIVNNFNLLPINLDAYKNIDNYKSIKSIYSNGKITLLDKDNGGKADALNAGFAYCNSEWILSVDGDTLLNKNCLSSLMTYKRPNIDAVASMVGISNDNVITDSEPNIPKGFWAKVQWMEYNRSYMLLRNSLKDKNCVTVIPGACSLISSEMILKTGGYKHNHLGEDMEHTLNILKNKGKVQFITKVLSCTEVPDNIKDLGKQRVRWFRGALQSYSSYKNLLFNRNNKFLGWLFLPYIWIADILGCWVELIGWIFAIYTIVTSSYDYVNFMILWSIIVILHYLNFIIALLLIKKKLKLCKSYREILFTSFIEGFTYHYLYVYWILKAHILEIFGAKRNWNKLKRKDFNNT